MEILTWFNNNYQDLINEMKNCSHNLSDLELSPYHGEGSVWTHTMMVYSHLTPEASIELRLAAILHDIGKPYTQIIREGRGRVSFTGHEHYSSFLAIDILNKYEEDFNVEIDKQRILYALNYHQILHKIVKADEEGNSYIPEEDRSKINYMFEDDLDLYQLLYDLSYIDMRGRISVDIELSINKYKLLSNYVPYKGTTPFTKKDNIAIIMVGLPGSGKSTEIEKLKKEYPNIVVLSIDEEVMNLNKYSYSYDGAWSKKRQKEAANALFEKMKILIKDKKDFIVDATNFQEKIRRRKLNAIPSNYKKIAIVQLAGVSFIQNVMKSRTDKKVSIDIIKEMSKSFYYPSYEEFHEIKVNILK